MGSPLDEACPDVGLYCHYKGGVYRVLGTALHTESGERLVVYCSVDEETKVDRGERWWARPLAMFLGTVTDANGQTVKRFTRIGE